jgi:hypothetical protein
MKLYSSRADIPNSGKKHNIDKKMSTIFSISIKNLSISFQRNFSYSL